MPKKALRQIVVEGCVAYVPLTLGKVAVIDAADLPLVSGRHWHAVARNQTFYAASNGQPDTTGKRPMQYMHRVILGLEDNVEADHRDCDGLNNRRSNLRPATRRENARNVRPKPGTASGIKGVSWSPRHKKWRAYIRLSGRQQNLGYYPTKEEAGEVYARIAADLHGDFVRTSA